MGKMRRGRFVKITVAESSLRERGPLWKWRKKTSTEGQQLDEHCHCLTLKQKRCNNLLVLLVKVERSLRDFMRASVESHIGEKSLLKGSFVNGESTSVCFRLGGGG